MLLIFMKAGWCVHKILFFATCPQHSRYNKVLCACVCVCVLNVDRFLYLINTKSSKRMQLFSCAFSYLSSTHNLNMMALSCRILIYLCMIICNSTSSTSQFSQSIVSLWVYMSSWFMCTLNDYMYLRECVTVGPGVNCVHEWFSWVFLFGWTSSKLEHWKAVLKNVKEHIQWRTCKCRKAIEYLETIYSRKKTCMTKLQTILSHLWAHKTIMLSSYDTHTHICLIAQLQFMLNQPLTRRETWCRWRWPRRRRHE